MNSESNNPLLIEVAWEVCNPVGGIYTVLRTKCAAGVEMCNEDYLLIGPYVESAARIEFEPKPAVEPVQRAVDALGKRGILLHTGRWVITHHPGVVLVDVKSVIKQAPSLRMDLWKQLGETEPSRDEHVDEVIAFGYAVSELVAELCAQAPHRPMLVQMHEWQGSAAIPMLRRREIKVPTIFTTHATLVGRSLSAANDFDYGKLGNVAPLSVARQHGIAGRFLIEKGASVHADVFTTVSKVTAIEAEFFLGRKVDVVLPNGLNVVRSAASPHEFQNVHQQCKEQIHEFTMGHFFPSYSFDLAQTIYLFSSGRYEYRNKGMDVFVEALNELNRRLKAEESKVTVVAFLIAKAPFKALNVDVLSRQAMLHELKMTCANIKELMGRRLFDAIVDRRLPRHDDLLDEYDVVRLQRMIHAWDQCGDVPPMITHDLTDPKTDPVLGHLPKLNLTNSPDDPVKLVFHPEFLQPTSPILGMEYDQFVRGCNLGVFPSCYEPWGYTPMECIVRGIPAITSDLSGFGTYLMDRFPDHDDHGMYVARRRETTFEKTVYQVVGWMHAMTRTTVRERIHQRNRVESHAEHFDWSRMAPYYRAARSKALEKYHPGATV